MAVTLAVKMELISQFIHLRGQSVAVQLRVIMKVNVMS